MYVTSSILASYTFQFILLLLDHPTSNNTSSRNGLKSVPFHILEFSSLSSFSSLTLKNLSSQLYGAMDFVGNIVHFFWVWTYCPYRLRLKSAAPRFLGL